MTSMVLLRVSDIQRAYLRYNILRRELPEDLAKEACVCFSAYIDTTMPAGFMAKNMFKWHSVSDLTKQRVNQLLDDQHYRTFFRIWVHQQAK